jgi:hypothetical protein
MKTSIYVQKKLKIHQITDFEILFCAIIGTGGSLIPKKIKNKNSMFI